MKLTWSTVDTLLSSANPIQPLQASDAARRYGEAADQLISEVKEEPKVGSAAWRGSHRPARLMIMKLTCIAKVVACEAVDIPMKLLKFTLDVGEGKTRTVFRHQGELQ